MYIFIQEKNDNMYYFIMIFFCILQMLKVIKFMEKEDIFKLIEKLGLKFIIEEWLLEGKEFMRNVMMKWLLVGDVMLEMIIVYFFFFCVVQKYWIEILYEGFNDDEVVVGKQYKWLILKYVKNIEENC